MVLSVLLEQTEATRVKLDEVKSNGHSVTHTQKETNQLQNHKGWNFLQEIKISMSSLSLNLVLNHYNASY